MEINNSSGRNVTIYAKRLAKISLFIIIVLATCVACCFAFSYADRVEDDPNIPCLPDVDNSQVLVKPGVFGDFSIVLASGTSGNTQDGVLVINKGDQPFCLLFYGEDTEDQNYFTITDCRGRAMLSGGFRDGKVSRLMLFDEKKCPLGQVNYSEEKQSWCKMLYGPSGDDRIPRDTGYCDIDFDGIFDVLFHFSQKDGANSMEIFYEDSWIPVELIWDNMLKAGREIKGEHRAYRFDDGEGWKLAGSAPIEEAAKEAKD